MEIRFNHDSGLARCVREFERVWLQVLSHVVVGGEIPRWLLTTCP